MMSGFALGRALAAFAIGGALGALFLWGLWFTVRRLPTARHPGWLAIGSFVVRIGGALVVLVWIARSGHWFDVLLCLAGFTLLRLAWTRVVARKRRRVGRQEGGTSREHLA